MADLKIATESAVGVADPSLAINLSAIRDYVTQDPFLDIMKSARHFVGNQRRDWSAQTNAELDEQGVFDANGWPTRIPEGLNSIGTIWSWSTDLGANETRAGRYVMTYEGDGTMLLRMGTKVVSSEAGRIVFDVPEGKTFQLDIYETDPDGTGDYIRDISIVREDHVALHEAGALFNPEWLKLIEDMRQIRFMDWQDTNNSTLSSWDDRAQLDDAFWYGKGVPVEVMVRLANEAGIDPWFTMPPDADEGYIRAFAEYVRDHLDPALVATVEFGNENWNSSFRHAKNQALEMAEEWDVSTAEHVISISHQAKQATESALIWTDVFGDEAEARLVKAIGVQTTSTWRTERLLTAPHWAKYEPDAYVPPHEVFDVIAATSYFGSMASTDATMRADLIAAIEDPEVDAFDWLAGRMMDPNYRFSIPFVLGRLEAQKAMAESYGLEITLYEGGQHLHHLFATDGSGAVLDEFMRAFVRSDQMAELYETLWAGWAEIGDGAFMQYGDVALPSKNGSWALYAHLQDDTPRAAALRELNASTPAWWEDRGGEHFQQGVIREGGDGDDVLIGTAQEDYLLGGAGDDVLIGGAGDDGIHGGAGEDLLHLSGTVANHTIAAEGEGFRVTGQNGSDFVREVELFGFDDETLTLSEFIARATPYHAPPPAVTLTATEGKIETPGAPAAAVLGWVARLADGAPDADGTARLVSDVDGRGLLIDALNLHSTLAAEISGALAGNATVYVAAVRGVTYSVDGIEVQASYYTMAENALSSDGEALASTALDALTGLEGAVFAAAEVIGSDFADYMAGRAGDDHFHGLDGNDQLYGRRGADVLDGGAGNDRLDGGAGADVFVFDAGYGHDVIADFKAEDTLDLTGFGFADRAEIEAAAVSGADGALTLEFGADALVFAGLDQSALSWMHIDF
jgi:hypothetical protein